MVCLSDLILMIKLYKPFFVFVISKYFACPFNSFEHVYEATLQKAKGVVTGLVSIVASVVSYCQ
jgi:hypothetical protein